MEWNVGKDTKRCPECHVSWVGDEILERYRGDYGGRTHYSRVVGIEYPEKYDGVWEWQCPDCGETLPRFRRESL